MAAFVIRAEKDGKTREATADSRTQAEVIAQTWWQFLWRGIRINDIPWTPPPA